MFRRRASSWAGCGKSAWRLRDGINEPGHFTDRRLLAGVIADESALTRGWRARPAFAPCATARSGLAFAGACKPELRMLASLSEGLRPAGLEPATPGLEGPLSNGYIKAVIATAP